MKIDWAFTGDGDLKLGAPKLTEDGLILYKHGDGSISTEISFDGRELRDIGLSRGSHVERQTIMNRLKTDAPDWFYHPNMAGNLSDLVGEPNTRETGQHGAMLIERALTYGGLYESAQINIRPVPVSENEIMFLTTITKHRREPYQIPIVFNLEHGLLKIYGEEV